jgi:hypothetical protein
MPKEILEQADAPEANVASKEIQEVYNNLSNIEGNLTSAIGLIRRIDVGGDLPDSSWMTKGQIHHALQGGLEKNYGIVLAATEVDRDEYCDRVWRPLTEERLAYDWTALSRMFRIAHMRGDLTHYERYSLKIPVKKEWWGSKEITRAPWDAQRIPTPLTQKDALNLEDSLEEDRIGILCEVLDPYRYRHDADVDEKDVLAATEEQKIALNLLASLPESWQKDLLAVAAFKHFIHKNINRIDLADQALELISNDEVRSALVEGHKHSQKSKPENIVEDVSHTSSNALDHLLKNKSEEEKNRLKNKALERANDFAATINTKLETIEKVLFDSNRLLPVSETRQSGGNSGEAGQARRPAENELGIHPYDEAFLERPIYGALAVSDDEKIMGARNAQRYGDCVITIKHKISEQRTVYTYGDTMNLRFIEKAGRGSHDYDRRMRMSEAAVAKLFYDQEHPQPEGSGAHYDYVEAQILGGVATQDIESITIPFGTARQHAGVMQVIKHRFPSIELKVSLTPTQNEQLNAKTKEFLERLGIERVLISKEAEATGYPSLTS